MSLGDYIRRRRKAQGITQDELASKVQRKGSTISLWETDSEAVPVDMLPELARALEEPTPVHLYELAGILAHLPGSNIIRIMAGMSVEEVERFEAMVEALAKAYVKNNSH
jgi:transcriptional regulator with XRE-family HTH domain